MPHLCGNSAACMLRVRRWEASVRNHGCVTMGVTGAWTMVGRGALAMVGRGATGEQQLRDCTHQCNHCNAIDPRKIGKDRNRGLSLNRVCDAVGPLCTLHRLHASARLSTCHKNKIVNILDKIGCQIFHRTVGWYTGVQNCTDMTKILFFRCVY